jgi:hypothetical protein
LIHELQTWQSAQFNTDCSCYVDGNPVVDSLCLPRNQRQKLIPKDELIGGVGVQWHRFFTRWQSLTMEEMLDLPWLMHVSVPDRLPNLRQFMNPTG